MVYETILYDKKNAIATLTLNRPQAMNSLNPQILDEMLSALGDARKDEAVRALVLRGAGKAFCAGGDLKYINEAKLFDDLGGHLKYLDHVRSVINAIEALPVPTIAVIAGHALAGGLELVNACDIAIATTTATIGDQHAVYGILPGGGSTARLPRKIGMQRALELIYTGKKLTGAQAAEYGIVLRAVPPEQLEAAVEELVAPLRERSRALLASIKSLVRRGIESPIDLAIEREQLLVTKFNATTKESSAGAAAFSKGERKP